MRPRADRASRPLVRLSLAFVVLVTAGCVAPPTPPGTPTGALEDVLPHMDLSEAHDHQDPAQHRAAWNMEIVAHHFLTPDDTGAQVGRYNTLAAHEDHVFVSAYAVPPSLDPGLIVVDVSEPAQPSVASTVTTREGIPIDLAVTRDGKYVFLAQQRQRHVNDATPPGVRDACHKPVPPYMTCTPYPGWGVSVVNVEDPTQARLVGFYATPATTTHAVKTHKINGNDYVFIASYGVTYASRAATAVEILRLVEDGSGQAHLEWVTRFAPVGDGTLDSDVKVHDLHLEDDPDSGKPVMYVSFWDLGVLIVDVSDPANPREISRWQDFDRVGHGNIHFARPLDVRVDGRRIMLVEPEHSSAEHAGKNFVVDTTDIGAPKTLGEWTLPGNPITTANYIFSPHYFDVKNGIVAMGHYHAGVWVLDLRTPERLAAPEPIGYVHTVPPANKADGFKLHTPEEDFAPKVWNVVWGKDGLLYASDMGSGLYVLRLLSESPGAAPYASFDLDE